MIHTFLQQRLPEVQNLFKEHKIKRAYAFGSVVTEKFKDDSDVDFLINYDDDLDPVARGEHLLQLYIDLEDLLNRKVDLVTERYLRNPYLIKSISETKELIYE